MWETQYWTYHLGMVLYHSFTVILGMVYGIGFTTLVIFPQVPCLICRVERFYPSGETDLWFFPFSHGELCRYGAREVSSWFFVPWFCANGKHMQTCDDLGKNWDALAAKRNNHSSPTSCRLSYFTNFSTRVSPASRQNSVLFRKVVLGLILRPDQASSLLSSVFGQLYVIKCYI